MKLVPDVETDKKTEDLYQKKRNQKNLHIHNMKYIVFIQNDR